MYELALFAGAGGGILGGTLLGWRTICAVENDPWAAGVLLARQNDGCLPTFPIWDDVRTFDGKPWRGLVDVISGGFPCQDISSSGKKTGIHGKSSSLWGEMARIIGDVGPRFVWLENSSSLVNRGLDTVLADLAALGFDVEWCCLPATVAGAAQARDRIWIIADTHSRRGQANQKWHSKWPDIVKRAHDDGLAEAQCRARNATSHIRRVDNGLANGVDRLRCTGNGQVPGVVRFAWQILNNENL